MARIGRPPLYNNCLDLNAAIELYFEQQEEADEYPTVTGLALALGFTTRLALIHYENGERGNSDQETADFVNAVKSAKSRIEAKIEQGLLSGKTNPVGKIFNLKNNFGWVDRQEVVGNTGVTVQIAIPEGPTQARIIDSSNADLALEQHDESCTDAAYIEVDT